MERAAAAERTRRAIVGAARRHLIDTGYHGLSMERVAAGAGVTRVTVYRRFGSKLGLLEAVADDLARRSEVVARLREALGLPRAPDAFRATVTGICRFWATDPDLLRRLVSLAAVDPEVRDVVADRERWRLAQVTAAVERLDGEGRLRPPFGVPEAAAVAGAVTSFPSCDAMAADLGRDVGGLSPLLLALLGSVAELG
ncbi:TetR/AcrR family transcriptional regulator [Actinomadura opuntiae]|uniref:TetR/AcrR family transcriptional regulator n=1 Tax=Actinomadura sp. OS1-43 TaxID=604315 RepID=UPI00255B3BE7|nr:TetR/AcrR family transcriptional regulator [Actinomadura sp. OS1-43]MDL4815605.1 helix-turn-helix domain-containing protein [Actinomadura sp. OS1-43]